MYDDITLGCFGGAFTFSEKNVECRVCEFKAKCEPQSHERLRMIRESLGIDFLKPEISIMEKFFIEKISSIGSNEEITKQILQGNNPFINLSDKHLKIAGQILSVFGKVSVSLLKDAYIQKLGEEKRKANNHANAVLEAIRLTGALEVVGGEYIRKT